MGAFPISYNNEVLEALKLYALLSELEQQVPQVHRVITENASRKPHNAAVRHNNNHLTFQELENQSNAIANYLLATGVQIETTVGILLEESVLLPVCILGILKAGATYVPISPDIPKNRIDHILADAAVQVVFTDAGKSEIVSRPECLVIELDAALSQIPNPDFSLPEIEVPDASAAYILYTSGSTGNPKGVIVEHGNLSHYLHWYLSDLQPLSNVNLPLTSSICFAAAITQLFSPLMLGETLHIIPRATVKQPALLLEWYRLNPGFGLYCVPTLWEELINYLEHENPTETGRPECLYLSGESLSKTLVDRTFSRWPDMPFWNLYGPTEATANISVYKVEQGREVFLGTSIKGGSMLLLNEQLEPVTKGQEGFIYISSRALARGYLNNPELNNRNFISSHAISGFEGETLYNTGDVGKYNEQGQLVYLGRKDQQIKIRGYRIELPEIEKCLNALPEVRQAACKVIPDSNGGQKIAAFIVPQSKSIPADHIRSLLALELPAYMIPEAYFFLEEMPKLANSKIDRHKLHADLSDYQPELSYTKTQPQTKTEIQVAEIWEEVLGIKPAGMDDNFFDLGGNSLKMIRLVNLVKTRFGKTISFHDLWEKATPAELVKLLAAKPTETDLSETGMVRISGKKSTVPLTFSQNGLWFILQSRPDQTAYTMLFTLEFAGDISFENVKEALQRIVEKNDLFRSVFAIENKNPVRLIKPEATLHIEQLDVTANYPQVQAATEKQLVETLFNEPTDLSAGPLIRFKFITFSSQKHKLYVKVNHLLFDGISINLFSDAFLKEFRTVSDIQTNENQASESEFTYADYEQWLKRKYFNGELNEQYAFWKKTLAGASFFLNFPTDFSRPKIQQFTGKNKTLVLIATECNQLTAFNQAHKVTPFITLLSIFKTLLIRYTQETDILVGVPFANRTEEIQNMMGLFVNSLVFRTQFSDEITFGDVLNHIRNYTAEALTNQQYPFEKLVENLNPERSVSYHPVFQMMFAYHDKLETRQTENGLRIKVTELQNPNCKFDLEIEAQENEENITLNFNYNTSLFAESTIDAFIAQFRFLLLQVMQNPNRPLPDYPLESPAETETKVALRNNTFTPVEFCCLHERFERQVVLTPDKIAVKTNGKSLTYRELNEQANQVAWKLRQNGIKPDEAVAIVTERSLEMMAGIFGILKAGGAYLPIDPTNPEDRINYFLEDSGASIILTQTKFKAQFQGSQKVIFLDDVAEFSEQPITNPPLKISPANLAYIIYTSGSTGKPKGVMIEHHSVINRLDWMQGEYPLTEADVILQKTPFTFDVSVWELFWWSFNGSSVFLLEPGGEKNPELILQTIQEKRITTLHFVPSMFNAFLGYLHENASETGKLRNLKRVFTSGEALEKHHVECFEKLAGSDSEIQLINLYGPTEATVDVSYFDCRDAKNYLKVPIGKPIANTQLYILGKNGTVLPEKLAGELCIGGTGLARGYLNNPELTAQKFFLNSFNGERLYRTGDLARWLPDGNIEFIGRIDHQVKIRGFRIELGEIENCLRRHPDVEASVTITKKFGPDDLRIVSYFQLKPNASATPDFRAFLRTQLPDYIIPSQFMQVDAIPFLSNGKLDLHALPEPFNQQVKVFGQRVYTNDYEKRLAGIWTQILKTDQFSLEDNFYDAGGHSLLLIKMKHLVDQEFGIDISVVDLFQYPGIKMLAEVIAAASSQKMKTEIAGRAAMQRRPRFNPKKRTDMSTHTTEDNSQKIAIIGMACRLPGADDINQYWHNLVNGIESITEFSDDELRSAGVAESALNSPAYVKRRGIINGAEYFDAAFFGVTPRDAEIMDPQHRVFLECAWHALEDGGYDPEKTNYRIGVFGGTGTNFHLISTYTNPEVSKNASGTSIVTGNDKDYLATRVSYKLNLTGPSLTIQSACSTSMAAIVTGINSLLGYQSDMVLAGGSTIELPEKKGYLYHEGGLESSDGHCRTFDKAADGTIFSRGAGVVLLKRYDDAIKDGDNIHAVILAGAINNDGSSKAGYTAPSVEGQVNLTLEALEIAGINPETISYVEAHGTATAVGDPIEVSALSQAFGMYSGKKQFCAIGSVKTNIGHTDSASGVAGLIKTALALKNKKIPAHLHFNEANPKIDFPNSPFYITTTLKNWETENAPRRAIVNSFGVGGTNACVIMEEAPEVLETQNSANYQALFLSAKTPEALEKTKENLHAFVQENPDLNLDDLAFTYQVGRKAFNHRGTFAFKTREELISKLAAANSVQKSTTEADNKPIIFMFPGQGNQYLNMGAELYHENAVFRKSVDHCCDILITKFNLDLKAFLFAPDGSEKAKIALEQTYVTQPAIFVISYAMAQVLLAAGIKPEAMIGHSVGEYVAACLAEIMTLEDALTLVANRGALIQDLPGGSMLAVLQNEDKILPFLFEGVEVAAVNNPGLCVVAGSDENIAILEKNLAGGGFFSKKLSTSHAFHSVMMDPMLPEFSRLFATVSLSAPTIPIISTVTGNLLTETEATNPEYWIKHVRKTVRFTDAIKSCLEMNPSVFLEVGPGQSLESAVKRHLDKDARHSAVRTMKTETEKINDNEFLASAFGNLWLAGAEISWAGMYAGQEQKRISLPGYPYEREAYAIDFNKKTVAAEKTNVRNSDPEKWYSVPVWERSAPVNYLVNPSSEINSWLIIHDREGLGKEIVLQLKAGEQQVYEVFSGPEYTRESSAKFMLNLSDKDQYEQLLKDLTAANVTIQNVVHLVNYTKESEGLSLENPATVEDLTFFSPLYLQQAFYAVNKLKDLHFTVVANGVFDVIGEPVYAPEKALAIGSCRVVIQEFPTVKAKFVDATITKDAKNQTLLAKNLIRETLNDSFETVVAYRNNYRWTENYNLAQLEKTTHTSYQPNGIYLITGGLGGLGLLTAKTIAAEVNATFVLTYNSPIPARETWAGWLEENKGKSFTRDKLEGVLELEQMGSAVILQQVNVSDFEGMQKLVQHVENTVGKINGVIHSAGAGGGGIIPLKTEESARQVFESKFRGTLVLDKIFSRYPLDFFWLYSSVTSILGESTRLDYCSANAFLDAFAYYRKATMNDRTTAVNWSGWVAVGMAERWEDTKSAKAIKTILRPSHELLSFVKQEDESLIYDVHFRPENDWIINSHFIISQPTVVGTTFIELAYKFGERQYPGKPVELKNLYFISPLMFEKGKDKRVRFVADLKNGKCKFAFKTQPFGKDPDTDIWHDHFIGELLTETQTEAENQTLNLPELTQKLKSRVDVSKGSRIVYNAQNQPLIDLGERWDIDNLIYAGENEWLAKLSLRPEFASDTDYYDFHPALMDKATSFALRYRPGATYLPFSYKSVKAAGKLPAEIYSYATVSDAAGQNADAVTFDITLMDLSGLVLMEIKGYTMNQVNDLPASSKTPDAGAKEKTKSTNTDFISPEEGAVVIKRMLQTELPEQLIVYPSDFKFMIEDNIPYPAKLAEKKEKLKKAGKSHYSRPALAKPYTEPATEMERTIAKIWQDILGLDKIGRDDTFTELGGNSLLAIQTIANMVDVLEVELSAQVFYDNPTVKGLAEAVVASIMNADGMENLEELMEAMDMEEEA